MTADKLPVMPKWKILLSLRSFMKNPIPMIDESIQKHGDSYITYPGGKNKTIITRDPGLIKHVMQKNHSNYEKSVIQTDLLSKYIGKGLLTINGSYWLKQRRVIQPGFHKKKLNALVAIMNKAIIEYCNELEQQIVVNPEVDMAEEMTKITLHVVSKSLFSTGIDRKDTNYLGNSITKLQYAIIKDIRMPFLKWWRSLIGYTKASIQLAAETQQMLMKIIEARKEAIERPDDLLEMLLNVRYEDTGKPMTDQQVLEESLVLFVAGHETSANAMTWMHYLLDDHPEEKAIILNEIKENENLQLNIDFVMQMKHISHAISESMRLYPPAWITDRVALAADEYQGIIINKGDIVAPYIFGAHRDERKWNKPGEFIPDRFKKENIKKMDPYSYFPFGGGPRLCIGQQFALIEMQLIIYHLYRKFDFKLVPNQSIEMQPLVTLRPRNGIKMNIKKR
ncbi:MAG: cytochrome P450 [Saprospiraceae bacterium]